MVCYEHIQGIETISIVIACAYAQSLLVDIIIPTCGTTIPFICFCYEIIKAVDAVGLKHFVALCKYGEANLTFLRAIKFITIGIIDICRLSELSCTSTISKFTILYRLCNRVCKTCLMQSFTKDAVTFQTLEGIAKQA